MSRALKVCPTLGCVNILENGQRLCNDCKALPTKTYKTYDDTRLSSSRRGYDANWRKIRDTHLRENPFCIICGKAASHIDHIIPRASGGTDDWDNLQSLCHSHHSRKTAQFDGGFGNNKKSKRDGKGR